MQSKPNILLTNDDGIQAIGIKVLAECLLPYGNVYVLAPKVQQSAKSHGIQCFTPFVVEEVQNIVPGVMKSFCVEGSPADCVRVGLTSIHVAFDYVFSGMNDGPNLGYDISYSGTAAAAMESILLGTKAVAISCDSKDEFKKKEWLICLLSTLFSHENWMSTQYFLNVNFPQKKFLVPNGLKFTKMGKQIFSTFFTNTDNLFYPKGKMDKYGDIKGTDIEAYFSGYISISPLQPDKTDYNTLEEFMKM